MSWAGGNRNMGPDGKATGAYSVVVVFQSNYSLLFFFLPYSSLLLPLSLLRDVQYIVQQQARRHETGQDQRN